MFLNSRIILLYAVYDVHFYISAFIEIGKLISLFRDLLEIFNDFYIFYIEVICYVHHIFYFIADAAF